MGFTSQDDLLAKVSGGQYLRRECSKNITPAQVAGSWHGLHILAGSPPAGVLSGSVDLTFQSCSELGGDFASTALFGIQNGGALSGTGQGLDSATKHIINVGVCIAAAAGQPWQAKLVDLQGYYRMSGGNVTSTTARTCLNNCTATFYSDGGLMMSTVIDFNSYTRVQFTNSGGALPTGLSASTYYWLVRVNATHYRIAKSLPEAISNIVIAYSDAGSGTTQVKSFMPRYPTGAGLEAFWMCITASTAGGPNLTTSAYDNTLSTYGSGTQSFQGSVNFKATPIATEIDHSGTAAAGRYGAFVPRQGGDLGIARVNSFTWSTGTAYTGTGTHALCICKPLLDISIPVTGMWSERDLVNQLPSLPQVVDGACLVWLLFATAATTNLSPFWSTIDFAWGG